MRLWLKQGYITQPMAKSFSVALVISVVPIMSSSEIDYRFTDKYD